MFDSVTPEIQRAIIGRSFGDVFFREYISKIVQDSDGDADADPGFAPD